MTLPPPNLWEKGKHADHDVVVVEVLLRRNRDGCVYSAHRLQDAGDVAVVATWPGGGLEQVAFGLLVEAIRREAILGVVLRTSADPSFPSQWTLSTEQERSDLVSRLGSQLGASVRQTLTRVATSVMHDVMESITTQS